MASNKQTVKLYWVTTRDHAEDWFIFAESARSARAYHEDYGGYGKGDANSRLIVTDVPLNKFTNGEPPCHAQMRELFAVGFEDAGSVPNQRSVRFEGKTYTEGMLEAIVELRRQQLAVTMRENGGLRLKEASSSTVELDGVPGVEAGPQLVNQEPDWAALPRAAAGCLGEKNRWACTRGGGAWKRA